MLFPFLICLSHCATKHVPLCDLHIRGRPWLLIIHLHCITFGRSFQQWLDDIKYTRMQVHIRPCECDLSESRNGVPSIADVLSFRFAKGNLNSTLATMRSAVSTQDHPTFEMDD